MLKRKLKQTELLKRKLRQIAFQKRKLKQINLLKTNPTLKILQKRKQK